MAIHVCLYLYYSCVCIWYFHPRQYTPHTSRKWAWLTALCRWKIRTAIAAKFCWSSSSKLSCNFTPRCAMSRPSIVLDMALCNFVDKQQSSQDPSASFSKVCRCTPMVAENLLLIWLGALAKLWKSTVSFVTLL